MPICDLNKKRQLETEVPRKLSHSITWSDTMTLSFEKLDLLYCIIQR